MKEQEYIDATDLTRLRLVDDLLRNCYCTDDPNNTRLKSVKANVQLMIDNLFNKIEEALK